ncbi:hypothetical protein ACE6H2_006455 [Prunus campanulata]
MNMMNDIGTEISTQIFHHNWPSFAPHSHQVSYTTTRLSRSEFTYSFKLTPGQKFIRLHFNLVSYGPDFDQSKALFSVKASDFTRLHDFNTSVTADVYRTETIYRVLSQHGVIRTEREHHLHSEFELSKPRCQEEPKYLDDLSVVFSVLPQNTSIELDFAGIAEYSALKEVYQTGRSMGMNKTINKSYKLTWNFPVDPKFYYLVRLHLCEFQPHITNCRDRKFLIYIANDLTKGADVIEWSGRNGRPVYRDYLVFVIGPAASESCKKVNISIALGANPYDFMTGYSDAILNGLEIFKLNYTSSNLAGHNPNPPPMSTQKKALSPSQETTNTNSMRTPMLAIIACVVSTVTIVMFLGLILVFRRQQKLKDIQHSSNGTTNSSLPSVLCHYFSLAEIKAATQNFSDICIIGRVGFGNVYQGYINGGATPIAIKWLKP